MKKRESKNNKAQHEPVENLSNALLAGKDLTGRDLQRRIILAPQHLAGSNLTNVKLPIHLSFELLDLTKDLSRLCNTVLLATNLATCFVLIATYSTSTLQILADQGQATLPVVKMSVAITSFAWLAPLILLGLQLVIIVRYTRLYDIACRLPAVFPDGICLTSKASLPLGIEFFLGNRIYPKQFRLSDWLFSLGFTLFIYFPVPATLIYLFVRYLIKRDSGITDLQLGALVISSILSIVALASVLIRQHSMFLWKQRLVAVLLAFWTMALGLGTIIIGIFFSSAKSALSPEQNRYSTRLKALTSNLPWIESLQVDDPGTLNRIKPSKDAAAETAEATKWFKEFRNRFPTNESNQLGVSIASIREDWTNCPLGWRLPDTLQAPSSMNWTGMPSLEGVGPSWQQLNRDLDIVRSGVRRLGFSQRGEVADLQYLQASGSFLENADFRGCSLVGADFSQADLRGVRWSGPAKAACLDGAIFSQAQLPGAVMDNVNARLADFCGADLRGARFGACKFSGSLFAGAFLCRCTMESTSLSGASLEDAHLEGSQFVNEHFAGLALKQCALATFVHCDFAACRMEYGDFRGATLDSAVLSESAIAETDFRGARLHGVTLTKKRCIRSDFSDAEMQDSDLHGSILEGCHFDHAILDGANLEGTSGEATFDGAEFDQETRWPNNAVPKAWQVRDERNSSTISSGTYRCVTLPPSPATGNARYKLIMVPKIGRYVAHRKD